MPSITDLDAFMNRQPAYKNFAIGDYTYGNPIISEWMPGIAKLTIGKFCSIADGVRILLAAEHQIDCVTTSPPMADVPGLQNGNGTKGDIVIGNDVWIGAASIIHSGITIGTGAVIGAGSNVTKNVEPYSIVGGNPAKHLRFRMPQEQIEALQRIAWWDWPVGKIIEAYPLLYNPDIAAFIRKYDTARIGMLT